MKKRYWILIAGVAAAGGAVFVSSARDSSTTTLSDETLRVDVKRGDLLIEVVETGAILPKDRVEVKSKVAGQVIELLVEEGAHIKKGQPLLRLDPTDYQREVAKAAASVAQANNSLQFARLDLARKRQALDRQGIAQVDFDLAKNKVESERIALRSAQIALASARDRLRYTEIEAPIDGTVLEVGIEKGEVVTPGVQQTFEGRPLLVIGDLSTLVVRCELNQIDIAKVEVDQKAVLTFDALPQRTFIARVTKTAPAAVKQAERNIEVFPVEATLVDADPAIRPGMTADVRFQIDVRPDVMSVPIEAVVKKSDGKSYVTKIVAREGKERTELAEVQVGARNDRELELSSGVIEGEKLLIDPASSAANEVQL